jgi:hypothetical protein
LPSLYSTGTNINIPISLCLAYAVIIILANVDLPEPVIPKIPR